MHMEVREQKAQSVNVLNYNEIEGRGIEEDSSRRVESAVEKSPTKTIEDIALLNVVIFFFFFTGIIANMQAYHRYSLIMAVIIYMATSVDSLVTSPVRSLLRKPSVTSLYSSPTITPPTIVSTDLSMKRKPPKTGMERITSFLEEDAKKDPSKKVPPIYEPGPYYFRILAALAYLIPIIDASDLGKYMFEAYPVVGETYNALFGTVSTIYNAVPFLPFAIFFIMSYIARAPSFPVEVRFHFAQAFMVALVQVIPSLTFGFLDKAGVPGMLVLYNAGKSLCFINAKSTLV